MAPPNLRRTKQCINIFRQELQGLHNFIDKDLETASIAHIQERLDDITGGYTIFKENQDTIETYESEDENHIVTRLKVKEEYLKLRPELVTKLQILRGDHEARSSMQSSIGTPVSNPKLPLMDIETFDGNLLLWNKFINTFDSIIHNNTALGELTKFQYLRSLLRGPAALVIESLDFISENYVIAKELLKQRYNKPTYICEQHLKEIFSSKSCDRASPKQILGLIDHFNSHLRSLQSLGRPTEHWDDVMVYTLVSKLDSESRTRWIESAPSDSLATFEQLCIFLRSRAHQLEIMSTNSLLTQSAPHIRVTPNNRIKPTNRFLQRNAVTLSASNKAYHCVYCDKSGHSILRCYNFLRLQVDGRIKFVKDKSLCSNCLQIGHTLSSCPSTRGCKHCNDRHHSLIHQESINSHSTTSTSKEESSTALTSFQDENSSAYIYLATALVNVYDKDGISIVGRALLDSGSQLNFITKAFASKLRLNVLQSATSVQGLGSYSITAPKRATVMIMSRQTNYKQAMEVHILDTITSNQPSARIDNVQMWKIPHNIKLADPKFHLPSQIDLMIGAEYYHDLLCVGQIKLSNLFPTLQNTLLGWIVAGRAATATTAKKCCHLLTETPSETLRREIERFWMMENVPEEPSKLLTPEEQQCELHFKSNTVRDETGRFVVRFPFAEQVDLGNSKPLAAQRFERLERRFQHNSELASDYAAFIQEYINLNHTELISSQHISLQNYYLPHHCVIKQDNSTTKLRVVFDGSAKTSNGKSLNEQLLVGPVVQSDLFSILIRFRLPAYAFSADIVKMYRQIRVHEDDQHYQYILWRDNPNEELHTFKLKTVTYGTSAAPFLATRCLKQLAHDNKSQHEAASSAIERDFYVDNLLTGANSTSQATQLMKEISSILLSAGMELRKWCTNSPDLTKDIPADHIERILLIDDNNLVKTLGIFWQPDGDRFHFHVNCRSDSKVSKRTIFSQIAKIYDPLGLLSPATITGKLLMQELWKLNLDWDQSLPQSLYSKWLSFHTSLNYLNSFQISRHIFDSANPQQIQIHGFADASERAYGAVIYIRSQSPTGEICVRLLCSKSRVAPIKTTTIPRLELCAALLLTQLMQKVRSTINVENCFYWSDSTITLQWINSSPSRWKTFVANRVASIQELSNPATWYHVPTSQNPADLVSRGIPASKFITSSLWTSGPAFLQGPQHLWPNLSITSNVDKFSEEINSSFVSNVASKEQDILGSIKFKNHFIDLQRIIAYVLRITYRPKIRGPLTIPELDRSLLVIIRLVQRQCFPNEYAGLSHPNYIVKDNRLKSLSPFMDNTQIIRVGGRIQKSALSYTSKHPILLPRNHEFTLTLLQYYHKKLLHAGPQAMLAAVRELYWPVSGRTLCKRIVRQCMRCFRTRPITAHQKMGNLPSERITPAPPFYTTGIDFCGPFFVHYRIRGKVPTKTYLCVFICFSTKAIHLELISDLSSNAFIGGFKRFVATRGLCKHVLSDGGTNFVGANNQLRQLYDMLKSQKLRDDLQKLCEEDRVEWKFTPPMTPHFGGLHESAVRLAKYHMRRMIGNAKLTYEELTTLIKQIEAILNSRPLMPLSSDPNDLSALTPGHFLIGRPLTCIAEPIFAECQTLQHWQFVQNIHQQFWSRWSTEYLQMLQQRRKWTKTFPNLAPGDLVILIEDNLPPLKWKLGRVIDVFLGEDGLVRVANVKTSIGIYRRGIAKLCPLPIENATDFQGGE